jgi:hypothetical protein
VGASPASTRSSPVARVLRTRDIVVFVSAYEPVEAGAVVAIGALLALGVDVEGHLAVGVADLAHDESNECATPATRPVWTTTSAAGPASGASRKRSTSAFSTLERYVEALGGSLEIHAVFDDADIKLTASATTAAKKEITDHHLLKRAEIPANCKLPRLAPGSREPRVFRGFRAAQAPRPHA